MLLREISYYQTGGTCEELHAPTTLDELATVMKSIHRKNLPYFLLGAGSNSLVMDDHWPGAVIVFHRLNSIERDGLRVVVQAGLDNTAFAEACRESSLVGASWMNCLPGQIGSTVRMNARCYGGEISRIVKSITAIDRQGKIRTYPGDEVFFGSKDTVFMKNREIVAEVVFALQNGSEAEIQQHMDFCREDRNAKRQFLHPSCGCVFKNDYKVGIPSGLLLEAAGARSLSSKRVEISPYHANFVFNKGASARELLETILAMRELAYRKFGVWLELEMELLGTLSQDLKSRLLEVRHPALNEKELAPVRKRFHGKTM